MDADIGESIPDEALAIFTAVGRAISTWRSVEIELFNLYSAIAYQDKIPLGAGRAFFENRSIQGLINSVDALMSGSVPVDRHQATVNKWKALKSRIKKHTSKRNKLAHGALVEIPNRPDPTEQFGWIPYFDFLTTVRMHHNHAFKSADAEVEVLSLTDINLYCTTFQSLAEALAEFRNLNLPALKDAEVFHFRPIFEPGEPKLP